MTSNVGQNYPYTSESEAERARAIEALVPGARRPGRHAAGADDARSTPTSAGGSGNARRTVCPGLLHVAGYAADQHALYVVCDGTCGKTFLR